MGFADDVREATIRGGSSNKSIISRIIDGAVEPSEGFDGLTELERAQLHDSVINPHFGTAAITQVLRKRGYDIGESSVRRYRQKHGIK